MPKIRISDHAFLTLRELAEESSDPESAILDEALNDLRRKRFFEQLNREYAALRAEPSVWEEEVAERRLWDQTVASSFN